MTVSAELRRRAPKQARSRFMVHTILDAAALVVQRRGLEEFTTRSVAEVAGVSVGSLYQYFPDKNALISMMHVRHSAELLACIQDVSVMDQDIGLSSKIKMIVDSVVGLHVANADLHRMMETELLRWEPSPERLAISRDTLQTVRNMLLAHSHEIPHTNIDLAAQVMVEILRTMAHMVVLRGTAGLTIEEMNGQIHLMIMNHLAGNGVH